MNYEHGSGIKLSSFSELFHYLDKSIIKINYDKFKLAFKIANKYREIFPSCAVCTLSRIPLNN